MNGVQRVSVSKVMDVFTLTEYSRDSATQLTLSTLQLGHLYVIRMHQSTRH